MSLAVLIPFRTDSGLRERLFSYVVSKWAPVPTVVGGDGGGGPFSPARAFNRAFGAARKLVPDLTGVLLYGADHVPDHAKVAQAQEALQHHPWAALYHSTGQYDIPTTHRILCGSDPAAEPFCDTFAFCTGLLAVRVEAWHEIGGMDERFAGWGCEDTALRCALNTLWPDAPNLGGTVGHLWHPKASRLSMPANVALIEDEYEPAAGNPAAMRAVLARARGSRWACTGGQPSAPPAPPGSSPPTTTTARASSAPG